MYYVSHKEGESHTGQSLRETNSGTPPVFRSFPVAPAREGLNRTVAQEVQQK